MVCGYAMDEEDILQGALGKLERDNDFLTKNLCALCGYLTAKSSFMFTDIAVLTKEECAELKSWWSEHKDQDAKRKRREQLQKQIDELTREIENLK